MMSLFSRLWNWIYLYIHLKKQCEMNSSFLFLDAFWGRLIGSAAQKKPFIGHKLLSSLGHPGTPLCAPECHLLAPLPWSSGTHWSDNAPQSWAIPYGFAQRCPYSQPAHSEPDPSITRSEQSSWRVYKSQKAKSSKQFKCFLCPSDHLLESFSLEPVSFLTGIGIHGHSWLVSHRKVPAGILSSIFLQVTYIGVLSPFSETLSVSPSTFLFCLYSSIPLHLYNKGPDTFWRESFVASFLVWWFKRKQKVPAGLSKALCSRQTHDVRLLPVSLWTFNPR